MILLLVARYRKKHQICDTIAYSLFLEKDSVIIINNGKIQVTTNVRLTCRIAKRSRSIPTINTASNFYKRCVQIKEVFCLFERQMRNKVVYDEQLKLRVSSSGGTYLRQMHRISQCTCHRAWTRHFGAATNIYFVGLSFMRHGQRAVYVGLSIPHSGA